MSTKAGTVQSEQGTKQVQMFYPDRMTAIGAFLMHVEEVENVVGDQKAYAKQMTRKEADAALGREVKALNQALSKVLVVAPTVEAACCALIDDVEMLKTLGDDERVSWRNDLVDHLQSHAQHVRQVFHRALAGEDPPSDPVPIRQGYQAGYSVNVEDQHPKIEAIFMPIFSDEDRARIATGRLPRGMKYADGSADPD